jgi:hypothetical protein
MTVILQAQHRIFASRFVYNLLSPSPLCLIYLETGAPQELFGFIERRLHMLDRARQRHLNGVKDQRQRESFEAVRFWPLICLLCLIPP